VSHRALNPEQFDIAQEFGVHPSLGGSEVPDVIRGRAAKHVMAQADIRQTRPDPKWKGDLVAAPHLALSGNEEGERQFSYPHGTVYTSQQHLHVPTLRKYATEGPPEFDPDYTGYEWPYNPEHYEHRGTHWLAEGHHRTVVRRLYR